MWIKYFEGENPVLINLDQVTKIELDTSFIFFYGQTAINPDAEQDDVSVIDLLEFETPEAAKKVRHIIESCLIDNLTLLFLEKEKYNLV